MLIDLR